MAIKGTTCVSYPYQLCSASRSDDISAPAVHLFPAHISALFQSMYNMLLKGNTDQICPPAPGRSALLSSQSPVPRTGYRKYSACTQRQSFSHAPVMCRPSFFLYTVISANSPLQAFFKSSGFNSSWLPIRPPLTMILSRFSAAAAIRVTNCFFMPMAVHPPRT